MSGIEVVVGMGAMMSYFAYRRAKKNDVATKVAIGYERLKGSVKETKDWVLDGATAKATAKLIKLFEPLAKSAMVPPHLPAFIEVPWEKAACQLWDRLEDEAMRSFVLAKSRTGPASEYRELRAMFWAQEFPSVGGWTTLRARLLYAIYPADRNFFLSMRDPFAVSLLLLRLCPWYGMSVIVFVAKFFLIDRTDEFQLVNYILGFKGFQFISSGILVGTMLAYQMAACVLLERGGGSGGGGGGGGSGWPQPTESACLATAPGQSREFSFEILLEPVRIAFVYYAIWLLLSGRAKGGEGELRALEDARLDACDGALDGEVDREYLRLLRNQDERSYDTELEETDAYIQLHRELHEAKVGSGGQLVYFVLFDAVVLCLCVLVGVVLVPLAGGFFLDSDDVGFWAFLYYTKCTYALLALPFLAFKLPVFGDLMHGALPTGYDRMGQLCPRLSSHLLKEKARNDAETELEVAKALEARRKYESGESTKQYEVDRAKEALQRRRKFEEEQRDKALAAEAAKAAKKQQRKSSNSMPPPAAAEPAVDPEAPAPAAALAGPREPGSLEA